jgi:Holliday junction resolvase
VHTNFLVPFGREEQGSWREVDVMAEQGDHHLALECKAYGRDKPLTVEDVTNERDLGS